MTYNDDALEAAAELVGQAHQRAPPARQGDRRDRRGRRARPPAPRERAHAARRPRTTSRRWSARWRASRRSRVSASDEDRAAQPRARAQAGDLRAGRGHRRARRARSSCRARACAAPEKPIGSFLFSGPTGVGKTELAKQLAKVLGRRVPALRHERVHGEAHRVAADRRAARLRRLRPGRPAHRRGPQAPALGAWCSTRSRRRTPTSSTSCCR